MDTSSRQYRAYRKAVGRHVRNNRSLFAFWLDRLIVLFAAFLLGQMLCFYFARSPILQTLLTYAPPLLWVTYLLIKDMIFSKAKASAFILQTRNEIFLHQLIILPCDERWQKIASCLDALGYRPKGIWQVESQDGQDQEVIFIPSLPSEKAPAYLLPLERPVMVISPGGFVQNLPQEHIANLLSVKDLLHGAKQSGNLPDFAQTASYLANTQPKKDKASQKQKALSFGLLGLFLIMGSPFSPFSMLYIGLGVVCLVASAIMALHRRQKGVDLLQGRQ